MPEDAVPGTFPIIAGDEGSLCRQQAGRPSWSRNIATVDVSVCFPAVVRFFLDDDVLAVIQELAIEPVDSEWTRRYLERQGLLVRDMDNSYLEMESAGETGLEGVLGSTITYRIAVSPHEDRKAFSLQSLPPAGSLKESKARVARVADFPLHAVVVATRHERQKLERLCSYITCPAIAAPVADAFREYSLTVDQAIKTLDRTGYHRSVSSDVDVASCGYPVIAW